ncbi:MAG: hypothetical protein JWM10_1643 [Myxococcaceae bacterium]|nr:hypothetical protein [Myxococcaceae bacterium]
MAKPSTQSKSAALQARLDHADAAYQSLQSSLLAIDPAVLSPLKGDLQRAAIAALGVALWAQTDEPHARFTDAASCKSLRFDLASIKRLESAALAAWYIRHHALLSAGTSSEAKLPADLDARSAEVRNRMFKCAEYNLDHDAAAVRVVDHVRPGTGYLDRANDLYALANLYRQHGRALADDRRHWRADDEKTARALYAEILHGLGLVPGADGVDWIEMGARAWHLLRTTYAEVATVGACLYRHEPADALFPNLVALSRSPASPSALAEPPAPPAPPA